MLEKSIGAAAFKTQCLKLLEEVERTRQPLRITKRGRPVAELRPIPAKKGTSLFGAMAGSVVFLDGDCMVAPFDIEWDAMK
jgi:prevent-host-death family protein